jgi:hypothetical protein
MYGAAAHAPRPDTASEATVLAFLDELEREPALLRGWLDSARPGLTLLVHAPGLAEQAAVERLLDVERESGRTGTSILDDGGPEVVLLTAELDADGFAALAEQVKAVYSWYPSWHLRHLPRVDGHGELQPPRVDRPVAARELGEPVLELSHRDTRRILAGNPAGFWHPKLGTEPGPDDVTALTRLAQPFFVPVVERAFTLHRTDRVYTIGSCFARGLESALRHRGFQVESAAGDFSSFAGGTHRGLSSDGFTNRYTPPSILNELRWALDPASPFPVEALVPLEDGTYADPYTNPTFVWGDLEETLRRRRVITDVTRRITGCRLVVITLGLIETWLDTHTGLYTNMTPPVDPRDPDRFVFHVLTQEQVRETLAGVHELLSAYGHPELEIVTTTSPVPLNATFTGQDVVVANMHSKSLLRTAASEWAAAHANVHYFPSYEIVMYSDRGLAWEADGRHVRGEVAHRIMELFCATHLEADAA